MDADLNLAEELTARGVLIVDDSALQRMALVEHLAGLGIRRVTEAGEGREALDKLSQLLPQPAVIFVDLEMPGMDGVELIQRLAELPLPPAIILASGKEDMLISAVESMIENLGLPLLGALHKPVSRERLLDVLSGFDPGKVRTQKEGGQSRVTSEALLEALASGWIQPFFQPKASLRLGLVKSVEALARWVTPGGELIAPDAFIPVAAQHGLMPDLTLRILDASIAALKLWLSRGIQLSVAINLSPASLHDVSLTEGLISRVAASGLDPSLFMFELTETAMAADAAMATGCLVRLRLRGCGLSIDDYGTGFSSMQQLSRLPFTELKVDRSFVTGAWQRAHLRTLLGSAIETGLRLKLVTVGEGVETMEDWKLLREMGCDLAQGWLISKALPADELMHRLPEINQRLRELKDA